MSKSKISALVRPSVRQLEPYSSAREEFSGRKVLMDANENALGSTAGIPAAAALGLNHYPDPMAGKLRKAIARYAGCKVENVLVGNGSDELIDLLVRAFAEPGESIITMPPTYGMYSVCANANGVKVLKVPLDSRFMPDVDAVVRAAAASANSKLVFLCSPNNPTGNSVGNKAIAALARRLNALLVVDEAYAEFSGKSAVGLVRECENIAVLRTFSKAWGLAGIRVGYAVASPQVIGVLRKIKPPYNVNSVSQAIALEALRNEKKMRAMVRQLVSERNSIAKNLALLGLEVFPSDSNFLLVRLPAAIKSAEMRNTLIEGGMVVRDRSTAVENCLRITIGAKKENARLMALMRTALLSRADSVLFDMDGVLADVSKSYRECIRQTAFLATGRKFTAREVSRIKSIAGFNSDWDAAYALAKGKTKISAEDTASEEYARIREIFQSLYLGAALYRKTYGREPPVLRERGLCELEKYLAAPELFRKLRALKMKLGIVTGRPRAEALEFVRRFLSGTGLESRLIAMDDCKESKPSPAPLQLAMRKFGMKYPAYVGDTVNDALSARAAGLVCIGIGRGTGASVEIRSVNETAKILGVRK